MNIYIIYAGVFALKKVTGGNTHMNLKSAS